MDKITKKYSIEEIAQKTHISPVMLGKLFSYKFDTISKIQFGGFIKILKNEFPEYDFKLLEEKADIFYSTQKIEEPIKEEGDSNFKLYFFVFVLLVVIAYLIIYMQKTTQTPKTISSTKINPTLPTFDIAKNSTKTDNTMEINKTIETNKTTNITKLNKIDEINNTNSTDEINNTNEINETNITESSYVEQNKTLLIIPKQKLWFRVTYLDTRKRKNYLQSYPEEFNGSRDMYIEFGHGMETLQFMDKNISPNTTKMVNFVLINGELNLTTMPIEEFLK
jgi:hypothetical protein